MKTQAPRVISFDRRLLSIAAAIVLLLTAGSIWWGMQDAMVEVQVAAQENKEVVLPDGSKVWMHGPAVLSYSKKFAQNDRRTRIQGGAYFEVSHDPAHPFTVETSRGKVEVLGTSFMVDADRSAEFVVHCTSGRVRMTGANPASALILTANEKGTYDPITDEISEESLEGSQCHGMEDWTPGL